MNKKIGFSSFVALLLLGSTPALRANAGSSVDPEIARIQTHLRTVEGELLARDVSSLSRQQRSNRAHHVEVLRAYRERGLFPKNTDFPGKRLPYFVDRFGTLCAMAHLINESGRTDIVEKVHSSRNNAYVRELADDPALINWLNEAGLSVAEAGRIQPSYDFEDAFIARDSSVIGPDAVSIAPDAGSHQSDGGSQLRDGSVVTPDATIATPDGSTNPDGGTVTPIQDSGSGCSVAVTDSRGAIGTMLLALAFAVAVARRRKT